MFKNISKQQAPFWLLAIAVLIGITIPELMKDGMFMDAMLYASVAHNLSEGFGTFWFPQFSLKNLSGLTSFHEQPPLVFGIQALFYKVFGDSMYTERIYTFVTMCITAWLIKILWEEVCDRSEIKKMAWLPLIIWITIPVCFWSYRQDMHENTMGIFTLASAIFIFRGLKKDSFDSVRFLVAGFFIFLATFSKGVPGLFTCTLPFIYWLTMRNIPFKKVIASSLVIAAVPIIAYGILLCFKESRESLSMYFFKRLIGRINEEPTVTTRLNIIGHIFSELIPQMALMVVVVLLTGLKKTRTLLQQSNNRLIWFFILSGFAGSLPLMLTMVQKGFYLVPAMPFFAIGISLFVAELICGPVSKINVNSAGYKIFKIATIAGICAVIIISPLQIGKASRNKDMLHDVYLIGKTVPKFGAVTVGDEMWNEWDLQCYLVRYFNISLDPNALDKYYLVDRQMHLKPPPENYSKLDIGLIDYDLYVRK